AAARLARAAAPTRPLACPVEVLRERAPPAPARRAPAAAAVSARDPLSRLPVFLLHYLLEGLVRHAVPPPTESRPIIYRYFHKCQTISGIGRAGLSTAIHNG